MKNVKNALITLALLALVVSTSGCALIAAGTAAMNTGTAAKDTLDKLGGVEGAQEKASEMYQALCLLLSDDKKDKEQVKKNPTAQKLLVKNAQIELIDLGFNPGTPDGIMGPKTRSALSKFQEKNSLSATGKLDEETASELHEKFQENHGLSITGKLDEETVKELLKKFQEIQKLPVTGELDGQTVLELLLTNA